MLFCRPERTKRDGAGQDTDGSRTFTDFDQSNTGAIPASPGVRQYPCQPVEYRNSIPMLTGSPFTLSAAVTSRISPRTSPTQSDTAALADVAVAARQAVQISSVRRMAMRVMAES